MGLRIDIVTIFPEYFGSPLGVSLIGKAAARGDIEFRVHDLRRWASDVHHTVDDVPFGGGPGMVMKPDVWGDALDEIIPAGRRGRPGWSCRRRAECRSPRTWRPGTRPNRGWCSPAGVTRASTARVVEAMRARMPVDEVSIGDYVLAGGEAAALVMIEAVGRLLPGVLGNASSAGDDSFGGDGDAAGAMRGLLEGPGLHPAAGLARARGARGAAVGQPRRDRALAPRHGAAPDRRAPARPDRRALRDLDRRDREVLAEAGFPVSGEDMAH